MNLLIQQPINSVDNLDALIIAKGVAIQCDDGFGIVIADGFQRCHLPVKGSFLYHRCGDLEVIHIVTFASNEIDFGSPDFSDVHLITPTKQFQSEN